MKEVKLKDLCRYWFKQGVITANLELIHDCMEIINDEDDERKALNSLVSMFFKLNTKLGHYLEEENPTLEELVDSNDIIYVEDIEDDTTTSN